MADLHNALKYLAPASWADVPNEPSGLDQYVNDVLKHTQVVLDSVPIPTPDDAPHHSQAQVRNGATKSSEVTLSAERSATAPFGHDKLLKEWGKPLKIKPSDNPLGLSVYKMSGKDSKGAWFARRSVHEGIGFAKFKKSLQLEFEKSLAEPGPPGTGNVRGIGGEERIEQIKTDRATVEVYRLSAQFPGPTAARDFVTLLITSDQAMEVEKETKDQAAPGHYAIISKPCDHPKTQPASGFVRGFYESVEFIREVPRSKLDPSGPEDNPVEWIMVTRSDPGGGIPRFLVERGTPSSICGDAVKFMDWACQNEVDEIATRPQVRKQSHQSWRGKSLAGIEEHDKENVPVLEDEATATEPTVETQKQTASEPTNIPDGSQGHGIFGTVAGAAASLKPYTPQMILNRLPGNQQEGASSDRAQHNNLAVASPVDPHHDNRSVVSDTSFQSAEDHWSSEPENEAEENSIKSGNSATVALSSTEQSHHDKELLRLDARKQALHNKFAATKAKFAATRTKQTETDAQAQAKVEQKHEREMKKHEEKYQKEVAKVERKQEKERKKAAERAKKHAEKDEKQTLTIERDEARHELGLAKQETESLKRIVQDLQKENTALVMRLGKAGLSTTDVRETSQTRSRGSSLSRKEKKEIKENDLATRSPVASLKGVDTSGQS